MRVNEEGQQDGSKHIAAALAKNTGLKKLK